MATKSESESDIDLESKRARLRVLARHAGSFAERIHAREMLFALGVGADPWSEPELFAELDRCAASGVHAALADAGRALLTMEHLETLAAWLPRLAPQSTEDREAISIVHGLLCMREGRNEDAVSLVSGLPHAEAVALHGLALLQLRQPAQAAARFEVLLAADALEESGELSPTYLPESTPVLELFLIACTTAATELLRKQRREDAGRYVLAARDALQRYRHASELDEELIGDVRRLLAECAGTST